MNVKVLPENKKSKELGKKIVNHPIKDRLKGIDIAQLDITQVSLPTNKDKGFSQANRVKRYQDRETAGAILGGRQKECGCKVISQNGVTVMQKDNNTYLSGVSTCGSVWTCPVCSNKINEVRAKEVSLVLNHYLKGGYALGMVTLTSQHNVYESCRDVKDRELKSFNKMIVSRKYKDLCRQYHFEGYIRALEVTLGQNGWHPHIHLAIVLNNTQEGLKEFAESLLNLWLQFNKGALIGGQDFTPILNIQGISKYITKWGAADELVKSNHKTSQNANGYTPFSLLRKAKESGLNSELGAWCAMKFKEYSKTFKGAKQLTYSKTIQQKFKEVINQKTDIEIVSERQEDAKPILFIKADLFKHIAKNQLQAYTLNIIESESILELQMMLLEFGIFTTYDHEKNLLHLENIVPNG